MVEHVLPSAHRSPQPKWQINQFSRLQSVPVPYNGVLLCLLKVAPSYGGTWTPSNTWFAGPSRVLNPNGILIGSAVFAGLNSVTDRPTEQLCYSVSNNGPHLHTYP